MLKYKYIELKVYYKQWIFLVSSLRHRVGYHEKLLGCLKALICRFYTYLALLLDGLRVWMSNYTITIQFPFLGTFLLQP